MKEFQYSSIEECVDDELMLLRSIDLYKDTVVFDDNFRQVFVLKSVDDVDRYSELYLPDTSVENI